MKLLKLLIIGMIFILSIANTFAIPEISYTNFARTAGGGLVLNSTVNVRITIFNGGVQVYQEIHSGVPTNEFGLFTVKLGQGTPVGPDTYDGLVANTNLNVRSESDDGGGYRFIQLSALLNTALKNEEAAGAVTLNDAYTNGQDIDVLAGFPVYLKGTGLIQSDATIAAINANGNKTLTTKQYVDAAIAAIFPLPPLTEGAGLEILPGHQYDGTSTQSVGIKDLGVTTAKIADAAVTTVKILDDAVTEPKLKMANSPVTGYIIKWNGTDMTWSDPTVFTSHPVVGTGTALDPITLYTTGVNNDDVLYYNGSQWTNGKVTSGMILDGTINNNDINNSTIFVQVTGESGTPFNVTNGNRILDFQGVGNTTVSLDNTTHTVYIEAGIVADIPLSGAGTALDHLILNYDATLDLNGTALSINTGNSNTWTANQFLPATNAQGNNLVAAINVADPNSLNADVLKYDNTLQVVANQLGFNHEHYNTWLSTQTFNPNTNEPAILANSSGFFNRNINTETAFALQGWAVGQTSSLLDFPTVAQGVTGVGEYSGATPSTNFAIGTVGLGIAGNGVIAIGTYGGARENNPVANVGTVGHAYNDNIGMADMNHGVLGLVSLTQDGSVEVATALSLDVNSGVTGINLGTNANDWAGYFIGKVNVTNNLMVGNNASVNNNFNVNGNTTLGDAASDVLTVNAQIGSDLIPNTDNIYNLGSSTLRWKDLYLSNNAWVGNDLSVTNDATVGGDLTVAGTTTSGLFVGQLDKEITNGDGIATFVFDNTADAVVEFDYAFYNEWTVTQTITVSGDEPALVLDGTNATSGFTLLAVGDGVSGNTDFYFDGTVDITEDLTVGNDLTVTNNTTTNTLNVTTTAVVGTDLTVDGNTILGDNAASDLVTFNSTVNSNFIPTTTNTYDLGSNTLRWRNLYLSNNAWIGNDLSVTNDATVGNNLTVTNNTTTGSLNVNTNAVVTGNTQTGTLNVNTTAVVGTDLTVDGNTTLGDAASDVLTVNAQIGSDLIPNTDNIYNLGSSTLRWNDLFLGPGTLHIGTNGDEGTMSYNTTLDRFEFNQDVYVGGTLEATTFDGNFTDGSVLFANANGEIAENNSQLFWDNTNGYLGLNSNTPTAVIDIYPNNPGDVLLLANGVDDGSPDVAIAGEVLIIPESGTADGNPELWVNGGDGVLIDGGATLSIGDVTPYTFPNQGGAADQFLMYNGTSDLEWYGFDNSLTVDNINKTVGFNPNFPFVFNTLIAFNPSTGPAIEATSSDASSPTVTIENTNPLGVALELVGAQPQTTALEITTGGLNLANGQMIVSSNAGVTGSGANGPSITINNNGNGLGENGGAIQVVLGHTAFSYKNYTPGIGASVNLSQEAYTVYDIVSNGTNNVTLPTSDVAADNLGTIIYILNNGSGTLNLPGSLGSVSSSNTAILVYTSGGWFRIQ